MFLRYFAEIERPFDEVKGVLQDRPDGWIPGLAHEAGSLGELLLAEVGFASAGHRVERQVLIELGSPIEFPSRIVLPIVWRPASARSLFPTLDGDLEVGPLGPRRTHLSINARYEPPLGAVGRAIDRTLLHRVAEATVKDFLDRAAAMVAASPPAVEAVNSG